MITSKQNNQIKFVASLKQKKFRDESGFYVVEGEKMVKDAILYKQKIENIFLLQKYENAQFLSSVEKEKIIFVSEQVFDYISDEVTPQGILAVVKIPESVIKSDMSRCILLDRVQDPGNVGTILRLSVACGVTDIFAISSADCYSQKAVRSSMSGIYHVNIIKTSEEKVVDFLKENKIPLISADMEGENVFNFKAPEKFCLCVGNEGKGISDYISKNSDHIISIPMEKGIESLNVAVATGVTLYTLLNNK